MGTDYYNVADPLAKTRELNDKAHTLDHFATKLCKLAGMMNTEPAKIEAESRTQFMRDFVDQLKKEIF